MSIKHKENTPSIIIDTKDNPYLNLTLIKSDIPEVNNIYQNTVLLSYLMNKYSMSVEEAYNKYLKNINQSQVENIMAEYISFIAGDLIVTGTLSKIILALPTPLYKQAVIEANLTSLIIKSKKSNNTL